MAVRAISGRNEDDIWHKVPLAVGLQYYALWWQRENERRQLFSQIEKIPEIYVCLPGSDLQESDLIV